MPELAQAITSGAVRLAAATAAWLRLVSEFDERGGWHGVGITSCAHWLAWQCGMSPVTACEHVRVARALPGLPRIAAAFTGGRLSYATVRALTRIAAPDCEAALLEFASSATASQTERFCRAWRRVDDAPGNAQDERHPEVGQSFESWTDDEGYLTLKVRMPAEPAPPCWAPGSPRGRRPGGPGRGRALRGGPGSRPGPRDDRLDLTVAIGVLMGNRDLTRRLAAEAGVSVTD